MELINTGAIPPAARKPLVSYLETILDIYTGDVISIFGYGSVTGPDFNYKKSDINLGIVLNDVTIDVLKKCAKHVKNGRKYRITAPLFLTEEYISKSLDTFPVEFINMKATRLVLFGKDVLKDIKVDNEDLRRECELQLKGKIITLRQAYLERALNPKALEELLKNALRSLFPVFSAILAIKNGRDIVYKNEILCELGEEFNINISPFMSLYTDKKSEGIIEGRSSENFISSFLAELRKLSDTVDKMRI